MTPGHLTLRPNIRARRGFTLVEVSLFLALLSIMTLTAGSVTLQGYKSLRKLKDRTSACNLARQYLEALGYNSTNFTISGDDADRPELRINNVNYTITMNATDISGMGEIKRYDIRVNWVNSISKSQGTYMISTYKSSYPSVIPAGRPITITNRESTALTDYQVLLTVDTASLVTAGQMRSDGNDIRFYDPEGNMLSYWIEPDPVMASGTTMNTAATRIWIKIANIPVGESKIYMDYGNPMFTTAGSNGNATFDFFDDFSSASLDTAKWTTVGSYYSISSGRLYVSGGSGDWNSGIYSKSNFNRACAFEYTMYRVAGNNGMFGLKNTAASAHYTTFPYAAYNVYDTGAGSYRLQVYEDGTYRGDYKRWIHANRWEYYKVEAVPGTGAQYYLGWYAQQYAPYYSSGYSTASPLKVGFSNLNMAFYLDNVRVRKLTTFEPIASIDDLPGTVFANRAIATIVNRTNTTLTQHQVLLTVDTTALINANKLRSDCRDLRFMDSSGKRLPYWIDSGASDYFSETTSWVANSTKTRIWIRVPSIPPGESKIYMDYGNTTVWPQSNGALTFDYWQDGLWLNGSYTTSWEWLHGFSSTPSFARPFAVEYAYRRAAGNNLMIGVHNNGLGVHYSNITNAAYNVYDTGAGSYRLQVYEDGNYRGDYKRWIHADRWEFGKIEVLAGGGAQYYLGWWPQEYSPYYSSGHGSTSPLRVGVSNLNMAIYLNRMRVRKFVNPEPIVTLTGDENQTFAYRDSYTISNNSGAALTDHQVLLTVNTAALITANKMRSDGRDIRFSEGAIKAFTYSTMTGTIADGAIVSGVTSGARGSCIHAANGVLLLYCTNGTFQTGELAQVDTSNSLTITLDVTNRIRVFVHNGLTGSISVGATVTGATSGARGTCLYVTNSLSATGYVGQIFVSNIIGTFQSGEQVRLDASNYVVLKDSGRPCSDTTRRLPYWIEGDYANSGASGINTTNTRIWVRVPYVPVGESIIYMDYGNASVLPGSNGALTFDHWQDGLWLNGSYTTDWEWLHGFSSTSNFNRPFILEYAYKREAGNNIMIGVHNNGLGVHYSNITYAGYKVYDTGAGSYREQVYEDGNFRGDYKHWLNANAWEYWKVDVLPSAGAQYYQGYWPGNLVPYYQSNGYSAASPLRIGVSNLNIACYMNAVRVRKYAYPEPQVYLTPPVESYTEFTYHRPITITNYAGSALSDFQVMLTMDTATLVSASQMRSDGSDIRFSVGSADSSFLPFWIEKDPVGTGTTMNTATTRIWIRVPSVPIGQSKIYMHYGYAGSQNYNLAYYKGSNNGEKTFLLFDDFNNHGVSKWWGWQMWGYTTNNSLYVSGAASDWQSGLVSRMTFARPFVFEYAMYRAGGNNGMFGLHQNVASPHYTYLTNTAYNVYDTGAASYRLQVYEDGNYRGDYKRWIHANRWEYYRVDALSTGAQYYLGWWPQQYGPYYSSGYSSTTPLTVGFSNLNMAFYLHCPRVRRFAIIDPVVTLGETAPVNYIYRRPITINNTTGSALTDHEVLVVLNTATLISAGKMRSNGRDIRFADLSGTLLPYWIEVDYGSSGTSGINTSNTRIWVRVPTIDTGSTTVMYMYYNNAAVVPGSNGALTFHYWMDGMWFNGSYTTDWEWLHGFSSTPGFSRPFIFEYAYKREAGNNVMIGVHNNGLGVHYSNITYAGYKVYDTGAGSYRMQVYEDGNFRGDYLHWINLSAWEYYKEEVLPSQGANYYQADTPGNFAKYYSSAYSTASPLRVGVSNLNVAFYMNCARVRKYASPEPSTTVSSEETGSWAMQ